MYLQGENSCFKISRKIALLKHSGRPGMAIETLEERQQSVQKQALSSLVHRRLERHGVRPGYPLRKPRVLLIQIKKHSRDTEKISLIGQALKK